MKYKEKGTYRLEMIIFRNFKGTKDEALDELQGDVEAFENGNAGWFSENYMPESPLVTSRLWYLVEQDKYLLNDKLTTESEDDAPEGQTQGYDEEHQSSVMHGVDNKQ